MVQPHGYLGLLQLGTRTFKKAAKYFGQALRWMHFAKGRDSLILHCPREIPYLVFTWVTRRPYGHSLCTVRGCSRLCIQQLLAQASRVYSVRSTNLADPEYRANQTRIMHVSLAGRGCIRQAAVWIRIHFANILKVQNFMVHT